MYGYNIRTLLQVLKGSPEILETTIEQRLNGLDIEKIQSMINLNADAAGDLSHSLIVSRCSQHPEPDSAGYHNGDVLRSSIASPAVWRKLLHVHGRVVYERLTNMLQLFRQVPQTAPSAGWLWESLSHARICKGGTFILREMAVTAGQRHLAPAEKTLSVTFKQMETRIFNSSDRYESTCDPTKYCVPFSGRNPTFDSFFYYGRVGVGLQMTLGADHKVNADGLRMLYGRLDFYRKGSVRENWFVFVIRKGSLFQCEIPSETQRRRFKFYTLELELPPGGHHFPSLAGVGVVEIDFAEVKPELFDEAVDMDRGGPLELPDDDDKTVPVGGDEDEERSVGTN
jgi:hypothetical protein